MKRFVSSACCFRMRFRSFNVLAFVAVLLGISLLSLSACQSGEEANRGVTEISGMVIPFELTPYNNIVFKTVLNGKDSLRLKFDSGASGLLLTQQAIQEKTDLLNDGQETSTTENYVPLQQTVSLTLADLSWESLMVLPVQHSGQGTAGRFGWDLLQDKVVGLNYDKLEMTIADEMPELSGYTKTKLEAVDGALCLSGALITGGKPYPFRFMYDSGYQRALLVDSTLADSLLFPVGDLAQIKENQLRNGAGKIFTTRVLELPRLTIGGHQLKNLPIQLLHQENPAGFPVHILGNELMKRFNTVIDFPNQAIYLRPNSLWEAPYIDAAS